MGDSLSHLDDLLLLLIRLYNLIRIDIHTFLCRSLFKETQSHGKRHKTWLWR